MAYGDGTNWRGTANSPALLSIAIDFDPVSEAKFKVNAGDGAMAAALALMNAWNTMYPGEGEATMPDPAVPTVKFARGAATVTEIYVREGKDRLKPLSSPVAVAGLTVQRVSTL